MQLRDHPTFIAPPCAALRGVAAIDFIGTSDGCSGRAIHQKAYVSRTYSPDQRDALSTGKLALISLRQGSVCASTSLETT